MQQYKGFISRSHHLVMNVDAVDLDELAVRVGKLLRWNGPRRRGNWHQERPNQRYQYQDEQREAGYTQEAALFHLKRPSF